MKKTITLSILISFTLIANTQTFIRSQLATQVETPWEITYGPDGYLWLTEAGGVVSRIDPETGDKRVVYVAPDFFEGSPLEQNPLCFMPNIGSGTLGMDLHPDFLNPENSFIYFLYSYNHGSSLQPDTRFKVARLTWDWDTESVTEKTDLVTGISNGYDHWGGRLLVLMRDDGKPYLFFSIGDHGISERNSPDCYANQAENPNNFTQDPTTDNGKIHRYNIDGSIPNDNPIPGNSFYTRGHRNPQGLMYNPQMDLLYSVEHGDRTDDEVNLLEAGMNYGWKWVRGYHGDNNFPGEADFIANYTPHPDIEGDRLVEAFYSFCAVPQPDTPEYLVWCTPAPSDGMYYNSDGIPEWKNSLLITSLKNGDVTDNQVHVLKLTPDGRGILPSTSENPNPRTFFGEDQALNGRLRDITTSPDGRTIYLINNNDSDITEKITVYTLQSTAVTDAGDEDDIVRFYPNPASDRMTIESKQGIRSIDIYNVAGEFITHATDHVTGINVSDLANGMYIARLKLTDGATVTKKFIRQ